MVLQVPYYKQDKVYTCGPASLKMVLGFFGKILKERTLVRHLGTTKDGTSHKELINFARRKGFYCYVHEGASLHQLKHFIDVGLPAIVNYIEPSEDEGHYSVVVGHRNGNIIMHDPWNGEKFMIKEEDFKHRWHDHHRTFNCSGWILVLSKKRFSIGREFNPVKR